MDAKKFLKFILCIRASMSASGCSRVVVIKYADNYVNFTCDKYAWDPEKKAASQSKYKKSIQTIGGKLGVDVDLPENFTGLAHRYIKLLDMLEDTSLLYSFK